MSAARTEVKRGRQPAPPSGGQPAGTTTRPPAGFLVLFATLVVLNLIGLVMVLSASSVNALHEEGSSWYYFNRQAMWVAIGTVALVVTMVIDYRTWRRFATPLLLLAGVLLVCVLVPGVGVNVNGSSRWLGAGQFRFQPSEFAKLAMVIFVADLLARRAAWISDTRITLRPVLTVLGGAAALLLLQPNLGTTIVIASIVFAVLWTAGVPTVPLAGWGLGGVAAALMLSVAEGYRRRRLFAFLNPWADPLNTGYQTIQSQVSLASGGLFGVGLGASRAKWGFLPYAHTDFIFAIIGEELGILGALLVVGLFGLLGYLGVLTALRAPDKFGQLVAAGITTWFCVQAFVNIGAVIGILPITGVPLPFISFGGSSLVFNMAAAGVLLNVSRRGQ